MPLVTPSRISGDEIRHKALQAMYDPVGKNLLENVYSLYWPERERWIVEAKPRVPKRLGYPIRYSQLLEALEANTYAEENFQGAFGLLESFGLEPATQKRFATLLASAPAFPYDCWSAELIDRTFKCAVRAHLVGPFCGRRNVPVFWWSDATVMALHAWAAGLPEDRWWPMLPPNYSLMLPKALVGWTEEKLNPRMADQYIEWWKAIHFEGKQGKQIRVGQSAWPSNELLSYVYAKICRILGVHKNRPRPQKIAS